MHWVHRKFDLDSQHIVRNICSSKPIQIRSLAHYHKNIQFAIQDQRNEILSHDK